MIANVERRRRAEVAAAVARALAIAGRDRIFSADIKREIPRYLMPSTEEVEGALRSAGYRLTKAGHWSPPKPSRKASAKGARA